MANNQESSSAYMDGVKVKISEKYKPPPKINQIMPYTHRLTLNKQIQDNMPNYEFFLENTVKEKIVEWRLARNVIRDNLKNRLQKSKEEYSQQKHQQDVTEIFSSNNSYDYSNILTPIPLDNNNIHDNNIVENKSLFNLSDFEADTSSPFDNMELKSINDMAELAQVLQKDDIITKNNKLLFDNTNNYHCNNIPQYNQYVCPTNFYTYTNGLQTNPVYQFQSNNSCDTLTTTTTTTNTTTCRAVPDIIKDLQSKLDNNKYDEKFNNKIDDNSDFLSLPKTMQDLTISVSSMGFPLSRVARVCKLIGNNHKKLVDHLLAMSELMDLGFSEGNVTDALLKCDNDRDKALDILIS